VDAAPGLDDLVWRDEILQVFYWYQGEGFGNAITARDLQPFLVTDEQVLQDHLEHMVTDGYLERESSAVGLRYVFTPYGAKEGARRFADEFAGLTGQAHGDCPPNCPHCKDPPRDQCVHCSPQEGPRDGS
jgi:hypothetical protein